MNAASSRPRTGILEIRPYVGGKAEVAGGTPAIKLSSNETPLGPSPKAAEAYRAAASLLDRYPDGAATALREALGAAYGLNPDHLVCGNGSDELIALLALVCDLPGASLLAPLPGFVIRKNRA